MCYLRLSRGSGTFLFYPVNNVYHSLYHSLYHSFPDTVILISQSCFSSSDHTAVDSALCFVTLRRHCLSLPDFDERLVPPVSSVLLHCSLSVSSLSRRARSGVETDFVLLRGDPDRNRVRTRATTTRWLLGYVWVWCRWCRHRFRSSLDLTWP